MGVAIATAQTTAEVRFFVAVLPPFEPRRPSYYALAWCDSIAWALAQLPHTENNADHDNAARE